MTRVDMNISKVGISHGFSAKPNYVFCSALRTLFFLLLSSGMMLLPQAGIMAQNQSLATGNNISGTPNETGVFLVVLGTVQDAGSPHIACKKACCASLFLMNDHSRRVVSLGLVDLSNRSKYLFEATPDMTMQMKALKGYVPDDPKETPDGIFLTHAHIGHYTGLMYLGKEAINANQVRVFAMPKMKIFLENNGPWSQLVTNKNIVISELTDGESVSLASGLQVKPLRVPHRDEYSETVGYVIQGPEKSALFIPDIDKWGQWNLNIIEQISKVDYAFLDATFFDGEEINNRDISEIPHPFVIESMERFKNLPSEEKSKIIFIHFNHTNPLLDPESEATREVLENGYRIARMNDIFKL